jgi:hypothetical protein
MTNLFNADQEELVGISSGVEVEGKVADNILQAEQLGEHQFSDFVQNNLFSDKPDLFTKIKQNKLKTFSSQHLTVKNSEGKQLVVKTSRDLFARLLILSKSREIDLQSLRLSTFTRHSSWRPRENSQIKDVRDFRGHGS